MNPTTLCSAPLPYGQSLRTRVEGPAPSHLRLTQDDDPANYRPGNTVVAPPPPEVFLPNEATTLVGAAGTTHAAPRVGRPSAGGARGGWVIFLGVLLFGVLGGGTALALSLERAESPEPRALMALAPATVLEPDILPNSGMPVVSEPADPNPIADHAVVSPKPASTPSALRETRPSPKSEPAASPTQPPRGDVPNQPNGEVPPQPAGKVSRSPGVWVALPSLQLPRTRPQPAPAPNAEPSSPSRPTTPTSRWKPSRKRPSVANWSHRRSHRIPSAKGRRGRY